MAEDVQEGVVNLAEKLKLVVPESVKSCRAKGEALSNRARNDVIKTSLIVLQATTGRNRPFQSEFEVCAQKLVHLIPELKYPVPPIRQDAFKPWVGFCCVDCMSVVSIDQVKHFSCYCYQHLRQ